MAKKESLITGVDIGSHAVKICQLQKTGKGYKVLAVGTAAIPAGAVEDGVLQDPEAVGKALAALLKNLRIKNHKIGISISGYSVIVKKISLEIMDDAALGEYLRAEAEQYIPFDIEEVYLDFQKLPSRKEGADRNDVMLVAAKKEVVNDYLDMLGQLKLKTVLVDVDGFALENIWETTTRQVDNVALIDIGASKMNINIISEGVSVLARDVVVGSEQLTEQLANALNIDYDEAEKVKLASCRSRRPIARKWRRCSPRPAPSGFWRSRRPSTCTMPTIRIRVCTPSSSAEAVPKSTACSTTLPGKPAWRSFISTRLPACSVMTRRSTVDISTP